MLNPTRRACVLCVATLLGAGLAGCAGRGETAAPAPAPAPPKFKYTESISSVLVSDDGKHLAALGSSHHYIFDAPPLLVRALHSPLHPRLTATFSPFHVDATGIVTGDYEIALAADASPEAQPDASEIGLVRGADCRWSASGKLKGQRYTGWMYKPGNEQATLNKVYTLEFTTDANAGDRAVDDAATPIRVAADGVQLLYYAPLAPLILPIIFLTKAKDH